MSRARTLANGSYIADNAITLAKMASGTDGNVISYDASGNPVAIVTGNDGQVLTSTGAGSPPAFEAVPASIVDGNVVKAVKTSSMKAPSHIVTTNTNLEASGVHATIGASSGSNYYKITFSAAGHSGNQDYEIDLRVDYGLTGSFAVLGATSAPQYRVVRSAGNHFRHNITWIDDSGSTTSGSNKYEIYHSYASGSGYLVHIGSDYSLIIEEIKT